MQNIHGNEGAMPFVGVFLIDAGDVEGSSSTEDGKWAAGV